MTTELATQEARVPAVHGANAIDLVAVEADVLIARRQSVERVVEQVMQEGVHYGPVAPGVPGTMLYKAGMEILAASFQLALEYDVRTEVDADGRRYIATARVMHQPSGAFLGSAVGECSTSETKFKWRAAGKAEYEATQADRRREKFKRDGSTYQQVREEVDDKANTAAKMACKRAAADAIQAVLGIRGMFSFGDNPAAARVGAKPAAQRTSPKAGPDKVKEMLSVGAAKLIDEAEILRCLKRDRGYKRQTLAEITVDDWSWVMDGLAKTPDVNHETGEVAESLAGLL